MPDTPIKKSFSPDWLVGGLLAKLGDMLDRLTGRHWQPTSSLATSELIERLKVLLDSEAEMSEDGRGYFVPHNIKLKMQWDKFSTDTGDAVRKLENELLTAAVDHINDKRYYTHKPLSVEAKPDYFTNGVRLQVSFERIDDENDEAGVDVMTASHPPGTLVAETAEKPEPVSERFRFDFVENSKPKTLDVTFEPGLRRSVGRTRENDIVIDDTSVSKLHASMVLNSEGKLMLADTGSTNGTYINDQRMAYGNAQIIDEGDSLRFGSIDVTLTHLRKPSATAGLAEQTAAPTIAVGDFEFSSRTNTADGFQASTENGSSDVAARSNAENKEVTER